MFPFTKEAGKNFQGASRASVLLYARFLALIWGGCVAVSLVWNLWNNEKSVACIARYVGQTAYQKDLAFRQWIATNGPIYVAPASAPEVGRKNPRVVNPAYFISQLSVLQTKLDSLHGIHTTSLQLLLRERVSEPWKIEALKAFSAGAEEASAIEMINGEPYFLFMRPFRAEEPCMRCHWQQRSSVTMGVSIGVPLKPLQQAHQRILGMLWGGHLGLGFLGLLGIRFGTSRLIQQIEIRGKTEQVLTEREMRLSFLTRHDDLTGLPNRLQLEERLADEIGSRSRGGQDFAILSLDLDRFKKVNDVFGHACGDRVLYLVGQRLRTAVRSSDFVTRWGGDKFLILLKDLGSEKAAFSVIQKVKSTFSQPFVLENCQLYLTTSLGVALFPSHADTPNALIRCAEVAMFQAKAVGPGTHRFFTPSMNSRSAEYLAMENELQGALERREFELFYQPQVDLQSGRMVGLEALLRWQHPEAGYVSPQDFIPRAEESGLILAIGEWVLQSACFQIQRWIAEGRHPPLPIAVNISACQLRQENFLSLVEQSLSCSSLDPKYLEIEITETVIMEDISFFHKILDQLKAMGVRISVDDFGMGYSSLRYLQVFPVTKIKIDRSFIKGIPESAKDRAIVSSIIDLGRTLNLDVVAEGVETPGQADFLRQSGCRQAQGYYFGIPVPAEEIWFANSACERQFVRSEGF